MKPPIKGMVFLNFRWKTLEKKCYLMLDHIVINFSFYVLVLPLRCECRQISGGGITIIKSSEGDIPTLVSMRGGGFV